MRILNLLENFQSEGASSAFSKSNRGHRLALLLLVMAWAVLCAPSIAFAQTISTIAGTARTSGSTGDGGPATSAKLNTPKGITLDAQGNIYIADTANHAIRRINASDGTISTVAGTLGSIGTSGDGGLATAAKLSNPQRIVLDSQGNLYIADTGSFAIRKVNASDGKINTIAGSIGQSGVTGDGGLATAARFATPMGIALDSAGNIYVADVSSNAIRKINAADGKINTIAGILGTAGSSGDGGLATSAKLNNPRGIAFDSADNIYFTDSAFNTVRKVTAADGIINRIAGVGSVTGTSSGDGGLATSAGMDSPMGIALDSSGNIYIAESTNSTIRKVNASDGKINRIAGRFGITASSGDGGPATSAILNTPYDVAVDSSGNIYIAETNNHTIRKISNQSTQTITFAQPAAQTVGTPLTLSATASSNLAVSYTSSTASICTVSGSTATFLAAGTCTITAAQAGDNTFSAASSVAQSFTVNAAATTPSTPTTPTTSTTTTTTPPPPPAVTIPVVVTTTPATTSGSGASGLGTASAVITPSTIAAAGNLNTSGPITYKLSSPTATSGSVIPAGSTTGTTTTTDSVSSTAGTLTLNVAPSNPAAAAGSSVAVSYDTNSGTFKLVSPGITRPGSRISQTKTPASTPVRAAAAAIPAAPVYQVTAPKILALNSFATLTATDSSGNSVTVNIPITIYAPGEVADLVSVSIDQYGNMGTAASSAPVLSRDGQVMSFTSSASNIGTFGNANAAQVFRYAVNLATVDLISQSSSISGTLSGVAAQSASLNPALSADGLTLAFASDAANLYPYSIFAPATARQLYTISGAAAISSTTPSPNPAVLINGAPLAYAFDRPSLSSDGTKLAFDTPAPMAGTSGGASQVYVKNTVTGVVSLVSSTANGAASNGASLNASISDDGRYVLFESDATNLTPGSSARQVYLKDLITGTLTLVSSANGTAGNAQSLNAKLSGQVSYTGTPGYAVFESDASNLVSASNNGQRQVYRVNLATGAVSLVSANASGLAAGGRNAAISGDGRFVVFKSAGAVTGTSAPSFAQIYVSNTFTGTIALVSADVNALPGNGAADTPTISADGRTIGFVSLATNLDGTATNGITQTYIAANKLVPPLVTGFWVNPNLPGQYWGIEQSGNKLWIGGFGFNNDNSPGWVFAIEQGLMANAFQGSNLLTVNGPTLAGTGGPAVIAANLGPTGLTVTGQTSGALSWLNSISAILRQDLVTGGSSAGQVAGYPETGWWYAPLTNQSFFLEVQGTTLQAHIAAYTANGKPFWYQTIGVMSSAQAYSGQLNACTGGMTPACTTSAGTINLTFSSTLAGSVTLPGGKTLVIQRWRF